MQNIQNSSKFLLKKLWQKFVSPYRAKILVAISAMITVALANALQAWLVKPALDDIFVNFDRKMLLYIPLAMIMVGVVKALATYVQNFYIKSVGQKVITDIQAKLYEHLIYSDLAYIQQFSTGKIISRFSNDILTMRSALSNVLTSIAKELFTVIFLILLMFNLDWHLAILIFVIFPLAIYPIIKMGRKMRKISLATQEKLGVYTSQLDETFKAIKEVKAYSAEEYEIRKSNQILENIYSLYVRAIRNESLSSPIIEVISSVAIAGVIFYGGREVIAGHTSPGSFIAFIGAFVAAYRPIKNLAELNNNLQEGLAAGKRLFDVLDVEPTIKNKFDAKELTIKQAGISFENIYFNHQQHALFKDLSFKIDPGTLVAFVGNSGGGKTTIANLIMRFYDIDKGIILIDGQNIQEVTLESLRTSVSLVSQDILLFDDSIAANIAYGDHSCSIDDVVKAAKAAAADEFIEALPDKYNTIIGQSGFKLSGGQKQRLSIARAILKDSSIIIFDEATSALDNIAENIIQENIYKLKEEGKTIIVIAHRLSSIVAADLIYVLNKGKIVANGTHQELLKSSSYYQELYNTRINQH